MACRLYIDYETLCDYQTCRTTELESQIRTGTLCACLVFDKCWALHLFLSPMLRLEEVRYSARKMRLNRLGVCRPAGICRMLETKIYEALIDLLDMASTMISEIKPGVTATNKEDHAILMSHSCDLRDWYKRLPACIWWTQDSVERGSAIFFLLHQQYHTLFILLHR